MTDVAHQVSSQHDNINTVYKFNKHCAVFNKKRRYPSPYVLVEEEQLVSQSSCILHLIYSFIEVVVYILNTIPERDKELELLYYHIS